MATIVDISDYQAGFNIDEYADAGHPAIILKASEGATWRSRTFPAWREWAHNRGLKVGIYHYLRNNPPEQEAQNFIDAVGGGLWEWEVAINDYEANIGPGLSLRETDEDAPELGTPMGSWMQETAHLMHSPVAPYRLDQGYAADWNAIIAEALKGPRPWLYSYTSYLAARPTERLTGWPLWIANYGTNNGGMNGLPGTDRWSRWEEGPGEYPFAGRTVLWQYTSNPLDWSAFNGSEAQLNALFGAPAPAPDPDPYQLWGRTLMQRARG